MPRDDREDESWLEQEVYSAPPKKRACLLI